jgi:diaminohydroxyphosphoribosylaminopyrimidine deaminase/5-amino-6-(5-phosphoribosylamino)uracil reductase
VIVTRTLPDPSAESALLSSRPEQTVFWTSEAESGSARAARLADLGVQVRGLPALGEETGNTLDLKEGFRLLRKEHGCHYTLTEGGGHLAGALKRQKLVDELRLFQAMKVLGDEEGLGAFAGRGNTAMADAWKFRLVEQAFFDEDLYLRLRPKE